MVGRGSLFKAGFCPAFAVQRKLAVFYYMFGSRKPAAAWFVNCNMKQHMYASTSELKTEQQQIALAFLDSVQVHAKLMDKMGLCSNRFWATDKNLQSMYGILNCIAGLKNRIYTE